jgi:Ca2+-binding RTX toxin-like protein
VINNWGTIISQEGSAGGGEALKFDGRDNSVHNYAGGLIEGSHHAVTGKRDFTIVNEGTMIGRNGSAVNFDTDADELVKITNHGVMEGRSAELDDSDGDAIDVDGMVLVLNYGRIAGVGAEGYHDGEPNVSEGIAVGGGSIVNNATGEIYGYGRAIQVDNSSNGNALGVSTIVNDGLIQGDGHGPEGVDPADAAGFDLRGNEAINLVGDYEDFVGNNSTGRIVGGISMGGARDTLNNSGSIIATGGSAIDMGAGNDQVNLYVGATVTGTILLGTGDDVALSTSAGGFVIDGGEGSDTIAMEYAYGGNDILSGGAGNDYIYAGAGNDQIDGGLDNDTLYGNDGDDLIKGGAGDDNIVGGIGADAIHGDGGNDSIDGGTEIDTVFYTGTIGDHSYALNADGSVKVTDLRNGSPDGSDTLSNIEQLSFVDGVWTLVAGTDGDDPITGSAGNDLVFGGSGNDSFLGTGGLDRYEGGAGTDTIDYSQIAFKVTVDLAAGLAYHPDYLAGADHLSNIENAVGTGYDDLLIGTSGANTLIGGAGNDVLNGGDGDDILRGGAGDDTIDGGAGFDVLDLSDATGTLTVNLAAGTVSGAGIGTDHFTGIETFRFGAGNDQITGGNGDDTFDGGAGNDTINGGAGDDILGGGEGADVIDAGSGDDTLSGGIGNDTLKAGSGDDSVDGGNGIDTIDAGSGDDVVMAGADADKVNGGSGNDVIDGGTGNDILTGGSGSDVFVFAAAFGKDMITDFTASGSSKDMIQFSTDLFADYAAVMSHTAQVGSDIVVTLDADHAVTLANTSLASLTADDFRFV